jgi:hypothetical protein
MAIFGIFFDLFGRDFGNFSGNFAQKRILKAQKKRLYGYTVIRSEK